ncbi:hypothetical protein ACFL6I_29160 [candidate division KSB1 bacterium]
MNTKEGYFLMKTGVKEAETLVKAKDLFADACFPLTDLVNNTLFVERDPQSYKEGTDVIYDVVTLLTNGLYAVGWVAMCKDGLCVALAQKFKGEMPIGTSATRSIMLKAA